MRSDISDDIHNWIYQLKYEEFHREPLFEKHPCTLEDPGVLSFTYK